LPFVLIAVVLLFVLPSLRKKHTSGPSAGTIAAETIDAMNLIDKGEQSYKTAHGGFTPHLADLLPLNTRLASDLAILRVPETRFGVSERVWAGSSGDDLMLLLAV
jgi:hypothetical protein